MHGSLYICASVYRCICTDRVYMYVFIGVYAWKFICIGVSARIEFICMCECL